MRFTILRQLSLPILLALVWTTSACRSCAPGGKGASDRRGGEIIYRVPSPPAAFNYRLFTDEVSMVVAFYLMGGRLIEFDHKDQRYVPGLAESWRRLDDGRTVELTLRDGIKFSDGHPITAEDVIFTLRAIYDPRTASPIYRDAMMIGNHQIDESTQYGAYGKSGREVGCVLHGD